VKSSFAFNTGVAAVVLALLGGCGQTGPLVLPKRPAKPATKPLPPPPQLPSPSSPAAQSTNQ